ncbi:MAG: type II CAAX endopeptidase family protein [bacterium]
MKRILQTLLEMATYLLAVGTVAIICGQLLKLLLGSSEDQPLLTRFLASGLIILFSVALVHLVMRRRGWTVYSNSGWHHGMANLRALGVGALAGFAMIAVTLAMLLLSRAGHFTSADGNTADYFRMFFPIFISISLLAIAEEVIFRGHILAKLTSLTGAAWANIVLSILFTAAHLGNEGSSILILFNIFLGSMVIGLVRFTRWGVPAAGGFHAAWNVTQVLAGATVSGETLPVPAIRLVTTGSGLMTGGAFGSEGSIWATLATTMMLTALILAASRLGIERAVPTPSTLLNRALQSEP